VNNCPLVIDLDGTLIRSDLLVESGFSFLKRNPFNLYKITQWLSVGKARLKQGLAESVNIDIATLPYVKEVLDLIYQEKAKGRKIVLATASHNIYAEQIAEHLNIFDEIIATHANINLSAQKKAKALTDRYGIKGFDYVGNSHDDIAVWDVCRHAIIVNPDIGVVGKARKIGNITAIIQQKPTFFSSLVKALRLHQWTKNILIFVPLLASHQLLNLSKISDGLIAFLAFGLCASSVYILNDLLDIAHDRYHVSKQKRPFASGALSINTGIMLLPVLIGISIYLSYSFLPQQFFIALGFYYSLTLAYSFWLKQLVLVDVIALAMLYTMRLIAGTYAFEVSLTFWMLAFSMFIFLSLALVKRHTELAEARAAGSNEQSRGRGYFPNDLEIIASLGASSGYLAVMVLALYIQDQATTKLYSYPEIIWLACPILLFWISRVWFLTHRGKMHEDPVIFAVKDKVSLAIGLIFGLVFWVAV